MTEHPAEQPRRPSPTSRARRIGAATPEPLRRPAPRPMPAAPSNPTAPAAGPDTAGPRSTGTDIAEHSAGTEIADPATAVPDPATAVLDSEPAEVISRPDHGRRPAPVWLAAVVVVLILALAVLDGWLLVSRPQAGSRAQREKALATAKTAVPLILSYNYQHFDSAVSAAKARLTGRATTDYVQAMTKTIKPTAAKVHAVVQAQTDGAGVESVAENGKQVTVVVFGEQKVSNTALTAPRIDLFRVRVTLNQVGEQWLVSKFDQI
jgi:Mce-associated membrane protein